MVRNQTHPKRRTETWYLQVSSADQPPPIEATREVRRLEMERLLCEKSGGRDLRELLNRRAEHRIFGAVGSGSEVLGMGED